RQNASLGAREWVVMRGSESRNAKSVHFAALIGKAFLKALKICSFKPFCGLGRTSVKVLDKEHRGGGTTTGAEEAA
ncbi:hypothetical protein ALC60_01001, partial [Trachymyrmex zeteki]